MGTQRSPWTNRVALAFVALLLALPALAQQQTFYDDFEEGPHPDWMLQQPSADTGWWVEYGSLTGREHYWAVVEGYSWQSGVLRFELYDIYGGMNVNVQLSESGRYFVGIEGDSYGITPRVFRQEGDEYATLAVGQTFEPAWGTYEIYFGIEEGEHTLVLVKDGELRVGARDEAPLPAGTVAFETYDESYVDLEWVEVTGVVSPASLADLSLRDATVEVFDHEVQIHGEIMNTGDLPTSATEFTFLSDDVYGAVSVPGLDTAESFTAVISLPIEDWWRSVTFDGVAEVRPVDDETAVDDNRLPVRFSVPAPVEPPPAETVNLTLVETQQEVSEDRLRVHGDILNSGDVTTPATEFVVEAGGVIGSALVPPLEAGERFSADVVLEIDDWWRGADVEGFAEVLPVPGEDASDDNFNAIRVAIAPGRQPPPQDPPDPESTNRPRTVAPPETEGGEFPWPEVLTVAGGAAAAATGIRYLRRRPLRRPPEEWEAEAEHADQGEPCQPGSFYCRVERPEVKAHLRKVESVTAAVEFGRARREVLINGDAVDELNRALTTHRLHQADRTERHVEAASKSIAKQLRRSYSSQSSAGRAVFTATVEGTEEVNTFTLRRCTPTRHWEDVKSWSRSVRATRTIDVGQLDPLFVDTRKSTLSDRLVPLLGALIEAVPMSHALAGTSDRE